MSFRTVAHAVMACALGAAGAVSAQSAGVLPATEMTMERIVVTATGWETRIAETSPAISVVTAEQLQRKQVTTVADALREIPGVDVSENGSRGGTISIFLRGAESDQVLVLVDGVEVNSTTIGSFDFSNLTPENIERIEVLRGWGGTLYGSQAVGGVIQIFTRRGSGPPRGSISLAGGNGTTDREVGEISGQGGIFSYSGSASHLRTEGFKPVNDDYENTVVSGRLDVEAMKDAQASALFRLGSAESGSFFNNNFLGGPDPDARLENHAALARGEWSHGPAPGVRYRLGFSFSRDDLDFRDRPDAVETSSLTSDFLSEVLSVEGQTNLSWFGDRVQSILGVEYESRSGDVESVFSDPEFGTSATAFDRSVGNVSGYTLQQLFLLERRLVLTGGVRVDENQRFGSAVSPSGGTSYLVASTGTRLRGTYAEGFKAPSLNELYFPDFGNPDLDAESSWEATAGFDQTMWGERAIVSASYFHREVDDLIQAAPEPDGRFLAANVGEATADGVEVAIDVELVEGLRAGGDYTFLDLDAEVNGRVRRPRHRGSVRVSAGREALFRSGDRVEMDLRLLVVGEREDFDPAAFFAVRDNPAYPRADLAASWSTPTTLRLLRSLRVFFRIENLFDRSYDEVLGFGARPLNVLAGVTVEM